MGVTDRTSSEFSEYLELYERASLLELGQLADGARWTLHPDPLVSYIIDRNINYTNVCVADCREYFAGLDYALTYKHLAGLTDFFRRLAADGVVPDGSLQFLQVA